MANRTPPEDSIVAKAKAVKDEIDSQVVELRTKLEIRTWLLRISLMFNMGLVTGIVVKLLS